MCAWCLCMYNMCVREFVSECRCEHVVTYLWRSEDNLRCWFLPSTSWEDAEYARLAVLWVSVDCPACLPSSRRSAGTIDAHALYSAFMWILEAWTQALMLGWQEFLPHWAISPAKHIHVLPPLATWNQTWNFLPFVFKNIRLGIWGIKNIQSTRHGYQNLN